MTKCFAPEIVTPNPEILLTARHDNSYRDILNSAELSLPDGIATRFAVAALWDDGSLHRHTGIDVLPTVMNIAEHQHEAVVILGGHGEDYASIQSQLNAQYPLLRVICIDPGVVDEHHPMLQKEIFHQISAVGTCVVLVALGQGRGSSQGKQERIARDILRHAPNVRFAIGVGGAIDVLAGRVLRAPKIVRRFGFEWMWRLLKNPWRFPRIVRAVFIFPICVAYDTLAQKHFLHACWSVIATLREHFLKKTV